MFLRSPDGIKKRSQEVQTEIKKRSRSPDGIVRKRSVRERSVHKSRTF